MLSENEIQRAVFRHLRTRGAPGVLAFHPKNGGVHQIGRHRGINAGLGVLSGVSDVICLYQSTFYALELKSDGKGPTPEQSEFIENVRKAGGVAECIAGLDMAIEWLEAHGLLIGKMS